MSAAQSTQTSAADIADLSNASEATAAGGNASPTAPVLDGASLNSSPSVFAQEGQPAGAPPSWPTSPATSTVQTKASDSAESFGDKPIVQSNDAAGSSIPNEVLDNPNSDSNEAPAAQPANNSASTVSASASTGLNGVSAQSNTQVVVTSSKQDAASAPQQPMLATAAIDETHTASEPPAQSENIAASNASGPSTGLTISVARQGSTSATPTDSPQTNSDKSGTTLFSPDASGRKQMANASTAVAVHASTQNGNALATPAIHNAHISAETKHSESDAANAGIALLAQNPASPANPADPQASQNPQSTSTQTSQTAAAAQGQPVVGPNAGATTQTNGTLGASLPGHFNPSTISRHDDKSEKVAAISGSSETAGSSTDNSTATTQTTTSAQTSDAGTFVKPGVSTEGVTQSHPAGANPSATQVLDDGPELSPGMHAWNSGENLQANLTGTPHVVEKLSQSEISIAMQADALGAVQVRAHVAGDQVGAAITVEHHDVHAMLSNDLSSLHQALAEKQLRVENLSVQQGYFAGGGISDGKSGQQQPQQGSTQRPYSIADAQTRFSGKPIFSTGADSSESRGSFDSQGRLSVRA